MLLVIIHGTSSLPENVVPALLLSDSFVLGKHSDVRVLIDFLNVQSHVVPALDALERRWNVIDYVCFIVYETDNVVKILVSIHANLQARVGAYLSVSFSTICRGSLRLY